MKRSCLFLVLLAVVSFCWAGVARAEDELATGSGASATREETSPLMKELAEGFHYTISVLGFGIIREPVESPLTYGPVAVPQSALPLTATGTGNRISQNDLNSYQLETDLRPDLSLNFRRIDLLVKPRFEFKWRKWDEGPKDGEDSSNGYAYVNEWLARLRVTDSVFVSYGRENLQWGPSYLLSPSNPFIRENGRNNPKVEVRGTDFARAVWAPSTEWSVSAIANTFEGEQDYIEGFHRAYALKIDYTGENKYFSLIPQYKETEAAGVGYFGGWNITDAILGYSEGRFMDGYYQVLGGFSYTFKAGPVISLEYYHNSRGAEEEPFFTIFPPFGDTYRDEALFRENYVMAQFMYSRIWDVLDVTFRFIDNIDDGSTRSIGILEYEIGNHARVFGIGAYDSGGKNAEFGSIVKYSVFSGVQYTF